jgi:hypothetical protein
MFGVASRTLFLILDVFLKEFTRKFLHSFTIDKSVIKYKYICAIRGLWSLTAEPAGPAA